MVNFNNESTVQVPPKNLLYILILQRSENLIEAWESYYKLGGLQELETIKARLHSLFSRVEPGLREALSEQDFDLLQQLMEKLNKRELKEATRIIEGYLYSIGITKAPQRPVYNKGDAEAENEAYNC